MTKLFCICGPPLWTHVYTVIIYNDRGYFYGGQYLWHYGRETWNQYTNDIHYQIRKIIITVNVQ